MILSGIRDANLSVSVALPNGATTSTPATGIDTGGSSNFGAFVPNFQGELLLECPALTTTQLPNATTITFNIIESANANLSSPTVVRNSALIVTGAGGVGCAAANVRYRPASNAARYYGFQAVGVATVAGSTANASLTYLV